MFKDLGNSLSKLKLYDDAIQMYDKAIKLYLHNSDYHNYKG